MLTFSKLSTQQMQDTAWDAQDITALLPKQAQSLCTTDAQLFAAWLDGQVIGMASLSTALSQQQPTSGMLNWLVVLPQYRRQGVGRMLMGLMAGAVMEMGAFFLRGQQPETQESAAFAEKIGFHADGTGNTLLDLTDTKGLRQH